MTETTKYCPCCGRHCDLSAPHCGRGEEYARTGVIPRGHGQQDHEYIPRERGERGEKHFDREPHERESHGKKGHHPRGGLQGKQEVASAPGEGSSCLVPALKDIGMGLRGTN